MHLTTLKIENLRCIEQARLSPAPGLNLLIGDNGAGKTSVLEAAYLVLSGRIRRGDTASVLRSSSDAMTVFAELTAGEKTHRVGAGRDRQQQSLRLDGQDATRLVLARSFPVLFLDPTISDLVEEGPGNRRSYLDWGVFHVEHDFMTHWQRYRRLLRQRNAALREDAQPAAWDTQLVTEAEAIDRFRRCYLDRLAPVLEEMMKRLFPGIAVTLSYRRGWSAQETMAEALRRLESSDRDQGYTHAGPHRADVRLKFNDSAARNRLSRGELKLVSMAMMLAQVRVHLDAGLTAPILLIDDLAAELSSQRRSELLALIGNLGVQSLVSFIETSQIPAEIRAGEIEMFHVEQGRVSAVSGSD